MSAKTDFWAEYFKRPSLDKETIEFNEQLDKGIQEMFDDIRLLDKETIEFNEWLDKGIQEMLFNTESEDNEHE
ncbi:hypothetical protein [Limosilactobacillus mucosae]|uniref:Uncharacterized protein n=1 Tax=Limosilactobacillus mucosae TaxID=97478 RepID=A0A508YPP1_LIMMU|nr:hypothetical protein [Limosilactobacillus mucosae]VTZ91312.1 hypothetical protein LMUP508_01432 [Limosilactobacillus mucosae]